MSDVKYKIHRGEYFWILGRREHPSQPHTRLGQFSTFARAVMAFGICLDAERNNAGDVAGEILAQRWNK